VLKKAGIVVATAAAGLLAVSPLAFAGSKGDNGHDEGDDHRGDRKGSSHHHSSYKNHEEENTLFKQEGDGGNNACKNTQVGRFDAIGGNSGLLGVLPILNGNNVLDQVNALQCVNVGNNNLNGNEFGVSVFGDNNGGHDNNEFGH
jgi:hypothetical protein